jgi:YceI-like protein
MKGMRTALLTAAFVAGLAAGCASRVAESPDSGGAFPPPAFAEAVYRQAISDGRPVFRVDPATSIVVVEVHRAGSLARLGHDHVVASHGLQGYVLPDAGRADLYVALDALVVDEPALRKVAGFDTEPTAEAIAATRANMLTRTLEAERFPFALISVRSADIDVNRREAGAPENSNLHVRGSEADTPATISITLHGVTRDVQAPLRIAVRTGEISASGSLTIAQSDFGIEPLSIAGGAIQVQDRVDLRFDIRAQRTNGVE